MGGARAHNKHRSSQPAYFVGIEFTVPFTYLFLSVFLVHVTFSSVNSTEREERVVSELCLILIAVGFELVGRVRRGGRVASLVLRLCKNNLEGVGKCRLRLGMSLLGRGCSSRYPFLNGSI